MESHARSIVKSLSYRIVSFFVTTGVVLMFTGRLDLAVGAGLTDMAIKLGVFYWHERLWNRIDFGREQELDYEI